MRTPPLARLAVLFLLALAAGCASHNKGKIEGTKWVNEEATIKGKTQAAGTLRWEFRADGSLVYVIQTPAGEQTLPGKYSLGRGDYVVLTFDQPLAGRKDHTEKVTVSGNQLTMTDSDGTSVTFKRAN